MSRNSGQWKMKFENKMYTETYLPYLINILASLSVWTFSPNLGVYGKPFLKLLVQVMFSVNGMQTRGLPFLIRSLYLLTIGESIIIAPGHTQRHTHTHTHTHKHTNTHTRTYSVRLVWMTGPAQTPLPNSTQRSEERNIHASGRIRTRNASKRTAADTHFRQCGHRDRREEVNEGKI